jgi:hypothetical protein
MLEASTEWEYASIAEILVVSDEVSCSYMTFESAFMQQTLQPAQVQFAKMGAPHDSILLEDLSLMDVSRYKMIVFLNCYHLTAKQQQVIQERVLCGNRTVLWCYAAGLFDGSKTCPERMQELTGFQIAYAPEAERQRIRIVLTEVGWTVGYKEISSSPAAIGHEHIWAVPMMLANQDVTVLGTLEGGNEPALAMKSMGAWTSVYTMNPVLPAGFLRGLAQKAGVHIFNDRDDTLYAGKGFIAVNADGAAARTIHFPYSVEPREPFTGRCIAEKTAAYTAEMADKETLLLHWREQNAAPIHNSSSHE